MPNFLDETNFSFRGVNCGVFIVYYMRQSRKRNTDLI